MFIGVNFESSLNQMNLGQLVKIPLPLRCRKVVVSSVAAMLVNLAAAEMTYLDAQAGPGGNTFATGGSLADTSWINPDSDTGSDDDQWKIRTFGNNADVFQALHAGTSIPELTTQITGLADGTYDVWVFFWDGPNTNRWVISAGLVSGALTTYSVDELGDTVAPVAASTLNFVSEPMTSEDPRILYGVNLGQASVAAGSSIEVYVDNLIGTGSNYRAWFDGVGYQLAVPENVQTYSSILGIDFNRNDALAAPSQSGLRTVSGSGVDQSENASFYLKKFGAAQVTISQPNGANFEFRGANTDSSRAIPGGDTAVSFLVSDFVATREGVIDLEISGLGAGDYLFRSWHLDPFTGSALGFAQGTTNTTPNLIEARVGGVLKDSVEPSALGSSGLNTTYLSDAQIPILEFALTHDGASPLNIELRSTRSNGTDNFLLLNGFELLQETP